MTRRIVVTGLGCVTPLGLDVPSTWAAMVDGISGIAPISRFDAAAFSVRIAAEVKGFDPAATLGARAAKRMDRFVQLGLVSALEAVADARLTIDAGNAERIGVLGGSAFGGVESLGQQFHLLHERGPRRVSPFVVPRLQIDMLAGQISIQLGLKGPNFGVVSACATGGDVFGRAAEIIRRGDAEVMLASAGEACVVPIIVGGFASMRALSTRNDAPRQASRPFDAQRDGFILGEGGATIVLESLEHAERRGARVYAELAGYGATSDAHHVSAPLEDGAGAARAMQLALQRAGLTPTDVDYVNAHGTSTPLNDSAETAAIKRVFGPAAHDVAISSTKSMTGHLIGAAGLVEAIACIKAIVENVIPPTTNYQLPDPSCDLDYVPNVARRHNVDVALSNSLGFGGHNTALVLTALRD